MGTLAGIAYISGLAIFNVFLLYAFKPEILTEIYLKNPGVCTAVATNATHSIEECFDSIAPFFIPIISFYGFFIVLFFGGLFGRLYEHWPGRGATVKGEVTGFMIAATLLLNPLYNLAGIYIDPTILPNLLFLLGWTGLLGYFMGRLYRRYTRVVTFEVQEEKGFLKIIVDGKDFTGKTRTFATKSIHTVRADASDGGSFREWTVSGGVAVEDPRSFETEMEVNGDGLLKALVSRKY